MCRTRNVDILPIDWSSHIIDYTKEDFTKKAERYDLILAVNGYQPISAYKRALSPNGNYVMVGGAGTQFTQAMVLGPWHSVISNKKMGNMLQKANQKDLIYIKELLEAGKVKPVIDRCYKFSEVPDAFRYFEKGQMVCRDRARGEEAKK